jgi:AcrR family transcriptional regulator
VADTKLSEVAALAKVDPPLIHYYFPKFEHLVAEVIQRILEHLKSAVIAALDGSDDDLWKYIRVYFHWLRDFPGYFAISMYFYHLACALPGIKAMNTAIRVTGRERIALILYKGVESGRFRLPENLTVPQCATLIQGILTGNTIMAASESALSIDAATELTIAEIKRLVGAT